ncbi:cysteine-rich motor neuron 1 protein isoform X2 [Amia ocellicauda]|uniref:cysteine-rich motor neuron 1 protein isoform X2 n=1 Tax=Amia ocellicauda TaxID=2972642 RepID=UPI003463F789
MHSQCWKALLLGFAVLLRVLHAFPCTPCELRTCPAQPPHTCGNGRTLARDPCGCCPDCTRLEWEPCGGRDWAVGSCGSGLTCAAVNGTRVVSAPDVGICKVFPEGLEAAVEDDNCPEQSGCNRAGGECLCQSLRTCLIAFDYPDMESCVRASKPDSRHHEREHGPKLKFVGVSNPACTFSGCNLTGQGCVCQSQSCHPHFSYINKSECQMAADRLKCAGVTCPSHPTPDCPKDSALSKSYTPPSGCCPTVPPLCTCNFRTCKNKECPSGQQAVLLREATGTPGDCCDVHECQRDVELMSLESTDASCWVNNRLRHHEEQWKEDDCTFCQCVDGDPHCTAMACKQTCQNPVKIPGECCPFCEEPTYETVSPILCPKLENCSLSEKDCPFGFVQNKKGCLLCQCLTNDSCPDLRKYCSLQCPNGYERDDYGCQVCECIPQTPKCRQLSCSKTCPYGYVRNKHGCEMCRCVKCPPFTCDKDCWDGYKQNKKGCSICVCKETDHVPSTTTPAPTASYCLTANGYRYEEGESWHDGCRDCYCHAAREMCVLITCPVPSCSHPLVRPDQCCPSCEDESGSGQPEGVDLVVCKAPGGDFYVEGETWELDECTRCTCRKGRVLCDTEVCPPVLCQAPTRSKDTCCYVCPDDQLKPLLPVNTSQSEYCISSEGEILLAGDSWKANPCTSCTCNNGTIQCFSQRCPPANCRVPVLRKGQCCPYCLDITTTVVPLLPSTQTPKDNATHTEDSGQWLPTTGLPPIIAITDGKSLNEDIPSQTEVALIYQSAAWILAGILLAIVIFLIVALLINKKKKWVQMSCYSAPKKTVILKKHVNKNSVVYMEPSKENKFQNVKSDCTVNFTTEASSANGERYSIPRAKVNSKQSRLLG